MIDSELLLFAAAAGLLVVTPGADTLLVIRSSVNSGRKAGLLTVFGICSGLAVHALFAILGLSAVLARSAVAFSAVKWLGAVYLVYLGAQSLFRAVTRPSQPSPLTDAPLKWAFRDGFLTNLLNPKVALFYLAFLPQFIHAGDPPILKPMLLATIHLALSLVQLSLVNAAAARLRLVLSRPNVSRVFDSLTGMLLLGFGIRLAAHER